MKIPFYNKSKFLILITIVLAIYSCALKPVTSEYNFIKTDLKQVDLEKLGNGTVLIYNGANIFHKIDNTARLNVWINNKALGQIRPREYVIINLNAGEYQFKALHIDVVNMRSTHKVVLNENTKIIKIKPTLTSNKLEITNLLPKKFEKYTYAKKR